jgi:hypothetical protein
MQKTLLRNVRWFLGSRKYKFLMWLLARLEHSTGRLYTIHARPLYAEGLGHTADMLRAHPSCALVLQGALLHTERFTLESVRMYKKMYPHVAIIVSTWEGEDTTALEHEHVHVLKNKRPEYNGPFNTNLQLVSSRAGIEKAKDLGATYTLKSRTDQRMYNRNIFETMTNLLSHFAPSPRSNQRKRILFATGGDVYRPYLLPDMFVFGDTDDMLEYWSAPLVQVGAPHPGNDTIFRPELYLGSTYLAAKGWQLAWTTEQMWEIQRECFISIDWSDIDLYWYKYSRYQEYGERKRYRHVQTQELVGFDEWFNIMSNQENKTKVIPQYASDTD